MGKQRRPPHPRIDGKFQEPTKRQYKNHEHYRPRTRNMSLPLPTTAVITLSLPDGFATCHFSIGSNRTIGICVIVTTHSSNDILVIRTTYFPLDDGSGDFIARHEASQLSAQLAPPEGFPSQSTPSNTDNTTPEPPEPRGPQGPPEI